MEIDQELVRSVRRDDPQAFARLVSLLRPRVLRLAVGFFHSPFDQEEAVQEVFILLWNRRLELDPLRADGVPGFVGTLARRRMIDLLRSRGRHVPDELTVAEGLPDLSPGPDGAAETRQLLEVLSRFEAKLSGDWKTYFRAVYVEGQDPLVARKALGVGALRAKYLKRVLLARLKRHKPLLELLQATGGRS